LRAILKRQKETKQAVEEERWRTMLEAHVTSIANRRDDTGSWPTSEFAAAAPPV